MADHDIKGIAFASVYVDDFKKGFDFYSGLLGLEKQYDMGDQACFFKLADDTGLYLQGGNKPARYAKDTMRAAFVFSVGSASALHTKLKQAGAKFVHEQPMHMGGDNYWFQFYDPAGNIIEALGQK